MNKYLKLLGLNLSVIACTIICYSPGLLALSPMDASIFKAGMSIIAGIGITFYVICLALGIFMLVCQWKMYVKAGESGWATIIPFYSNYVMFKIAVGNGWKMFFMLIPLFNIGYAFYALYKLGKAYGYGFGMFLLLLFLPVIGLAILGLGKAEYIGCE